ncbi:MAG: hypothetical protein E7376_03965 [Clostridiales bacterium]|nr:hypothetical protein [Clostridiales bacterium]
MAKEGHRFLYPKRCIGVLTTMFWYYIGYIRARAVVIVDIVVVEVAIIVDIPRIVSVARVRRTKPKIGRQKALNLALRLKIYNKKTVYFS